jgi:hypothetical protein
MIFCIGQRLVYERAFAAEPRVVKEGRSPEGYPGGWVWQTREAAQEFLARNGLNFTHDVYGVIAEWETGTEQLAGEAYRRLLKPAEVVRLGA